MAACSKPQVARRSSCRVLPALGVAVCSAAAGSAQLPSCWGVSPRWRRFEAPCAVGKLGRFARGGSATATATGTSRSPRQDPIEVPDILAELVVTSDAEVEELFDKYDPDCSGEIDKEEFKAIASEMKIESLRRTVITGAAAVLSGIFVGSYSKEFQLTQALTRRFYVDWAAEQAMNTFFPTAMLGNDINMNVQSVLGDRGFTGDNTLFAHSVCPDELNSKAEELVALMQGTWGEAFSLGGLAGVPFAGKSGFEAFLHHTPDKGRVLIVFAPHVGVNHDGQVGHIERQGQHHDSTACGAAVGAYRYLTKSHTDSDSSGLRSVAYDNQLEYIVTAMRPLLEGMEKSKNDQAYVSYQTYNIARDLMSSTLKSVADIFDWCDELAVVGGVMINRNKGGDFFQPLMFQSKTRDGATVDLFSQAFGARPRLAEVLGSEDKAQRVLKGIW